MSLQNILIDPGSLRKALFCLAGAAALLAFLVKKIREKRSPEPRVIRLTLDSKPAPGRTREDALPPEAPLVSTAPETVEFTPPPQPAFAPPEAFEVSRQPEPVSAVATSEIPEPLAPQAPEPAPRVAVAEEALPTVSPAVYSFLTLQQRSPVILDIVRGALIMFAIVMAGALLLTVLPQRAVDRMAVALRPRNAPGPPPEKIAFLYLGDEVKDNQFHIRGAVRNITTQPIEQLEATVRIYAPDHTLLETQVVRMDSEIVFPNAIASFHLSFPDYHGQFGSYSLDFKLALGDPVPYKDMREARASN